MEYVCSLCGRCFPKSKKLQVHISREHEGSSFPYADFSFDPDFVCGHVNALEEEKCDLEHPVAKWPRNNDYLEEDSVSDDDPGTEMELEYELEYQSFDIDDNEDDEVDEDGNDIDIDINVNGNNDDDDFDINNIVNDGEDAIGLKDQAAVIGPDVLQKLMDNYYAEKAAKTEIPIEMEATIDLLSMLRQSNASFALYNKIVSWMER